GGGGGAPAGEGGRGALAPPMTPSLYWPLSVRPMRKPVSGSPSMAMSGTTREGVPGAFASAAGTTPAWYAGCSYTSLVPPPEPNTNVPGAAGDQVCVWAPASSLLVTRKLTAVAQPTSHRRPFLS